MEEGEDEDEDEDEESFLPAPEWVLWDCMAGWLRYVREGFDKDGGRM